MQIAASQNDGLIRLRQISHVSFCQQSIFNEAVGRVFHRVWSDIRYHLFQVPPRGAGTFGTLITKIDFEKMQEALYLPFIKTIGRIDVLPMQKNHRSMFDPNQRFAQKKILADA